MNVSILMLMLSISLMRKQIGGMVLVLLVNRKNRVILQLQRMDSNFLILDCRMIKKRIPKINSELDTFYI